MRICQTIRCGNRGSQYVLFLIQTAGVAWLNELRRKKRSAPRWADELLYVRSVVDNRIDSMLPSAPIRVADQS